MRQRRRIRDLTVFVVIVSLVFAAGSQSWVRESAGIRLPGARAAIDASRYASIQAAIDALPDSGGVVSLPPGTF